MMAPNFAKHPFLNTRPVWLLTAVAGVVAIVLIVVNIVLYRSSSQELRQQIAVEGTLLEERQTVKGNLREVIGELQTVRWRSLRERVEILNTVLKQHGFSWLLMLNHIEGALPREVRLVRVSPNIGDQGVSVSLRGVAKKDRGIGRLGRGPGEAQQFIDRHVARASQGVPHRDVDA